MFQNKERKTQNAQKAQPKPVSKQGTSNSNAQNKDLCQKMQTKNRMLQQIYSQTKSDGKKL